MAFLAEVSGAKCTAATSRLCAWARQHDVDLRRRHAAQPNRPLLLSGPPQPRAGAGPAVEGRTAPDADLPARPARAVVEVCGEVAWGHLLTDPASISVSRGQGRHRQMSVGRLDSKAVTTNRQRLSRHHYQLFIRPSPSPARSFYAICLHGGMSSVTLPIRISASAVRIVTMFLFYFAVLG